MNPGRLKGMGTRRSGQSGLTLTEVLIALVVISIGVGVFLQMQKRSGANFAGNSRMMRAGQLVEKNVEAMRISIARDTIANWPPHDTSFTENSIVFKRVILPAASPKKAEPLPNVRQVLITVTWGKAHSDTLDVATYVSRRF